MLLFTTTTFFLVLGDFWRVGWLMMLHDAVIWRAAVSLVVSSLAQLVGS
jgi:hypothetical protein